MKIHFNHSDSDILISAIEKLGIEIHDYDNCDDELETFLFYVGDEERHLKDIALIAYGNDFPGTVNKIRHLRLIGDGECPHCGYNRFQDLIDGYRCRKCGEFNEIEWTPNAVYGHNWN